MRGSAAFRAAVAPGGVLAGPWVKNELWRRARAVPSLDLRFAENKSLVDATTGANLVTFTRASSGTFVNSEGLIQTATTNEARFDHNPTTGESLGLLVEEQRTNLFLQSNQFDTTWANLNSSETAAASTGPDGTNTAWELRDTVDVSSTGHAIQQIIAFTSGTTYTVSVWAKAGTLPTVNSLGIVFPSAAFGSTLISRFNLTAGTVASAAAGSTNTITAYPNGWYRCTMSLTATATSNANIGFRTGTNTATSYIGNGNGTIFLWGAQVEAGAFPTSYIPTTTATVTRSADVASISGSNFSSWYRQDEGTVYTAYSKQATGVAGYAASLTETLSTSSANRIQFSVNTNNVPSYALVAAGTTQGTLAPGGTAPTYITAYGYKLDDLACSSSGSAVVTDSTASMPSGVAYLNIGANPAGSAVFLNGTICRLTYWPQRLPNSTLQTITQ